MIEGLRSLLKSAEGLHVVAAETSLMDGVETVRQAKPSILIVDKAFGYRALSDWLVALRACSSPVATIVWGDAFSDAEALLFVRAGAAGILRKTAPLETVVECLHTVQRGNTWMGGDILREYSSSYPAHSPLTSREGQVLELVERGLKNKEIATALGVQVGTVKIHLKHIFEKTGVRGRYGLALNGIRERARLAASTSRG